MEQINELQEIKVSYKKNFKGATVRDSQTAFESVLEAYRKDDAQLEMKEYFYVIYLNRANEVIGYYRLSEGGVSGTIVDIRIAFSVALKSIASGIILVHNHPSQNLKPSLPDKRITEKFREAGELLEVRVLDHIIISSTEFYSFADNGLL